MRDEKSADLDRLIAERVSRNHRFQGPNFFAEFFKQSDDQGVVEQELIEEKEAHDVYEKYNALTHNSKSEQLLTRRFLKKYVAFVKNHKPKLTDEASAYITKKWTELRIKDFEYTKVKGGARVIPITVRTLESLIRLSTAHAKLRLSAYVEMQDCDAALYLLHRTLFQEDDDERKNRPYEEGEMEESNVVVIPKSQGGRNLKMDKENQVSQTSSNLKVIGGFIAAGYQERRDGEPVYDY